MNAKRKTIIGFMLIFLLCFPVSFLGIDKDVYAITSIPANELTTHQGDQVTGDDIVNVGRYLLGRGFTYDSVGTCTGFVTRILSYLHVGIELVSGIPYDWFYCYHSPDLWDDPGYKYTAAYGPSGWLSQIRKMEAAGKAEYIGCIPLSNPELSQTLGIQNGDILITPEGTSSSGHVAVAYIDTDGRAKSFGAANSGISVSEFKNITYGKQGDTYVYRIVKSNGNLEILKKDYNGYVKEGATFEITGPGGTWTKTTDANGRIYLENIQAGEYTVTEIQAPVNMTNGEQGRSTPVTVTPGQTVTYERVNDYQRGSSSIKKVDIYEGTNKGDATLEGAKYTLYAAEDIYEGVQLIHHKGKNIVTVTTKKDGTTNPVENLPLGSYYWQETQAPRGYLMNSEKIEFTISYAGQYVAKVANAEFTASEDKIYGRGRVLKIDQSSPDSTEMNPAEGAVLRLTLDSDPTQYYEATIDKYGNAEFIDKKFAEAHPEEECTIPYGAYTITEVQPSNAGTNTQFYFQPEPVVISKDGEVVRKIVIDYEILLYLKVQKIDSESELPVKMAGAEFKIWDCQKNEFVTQIAYPSGETDVFVTNEEGYFITPKTLETGKYIVYETKAPAGYSIKEEWKLPANTADYGVEGKGGKVVRLDKEILDDDIDLEYDQDRNIICTIEMDDEPLKGKLKVIKTGEMLTSANGEETEYGQKVTPEYTYKGLEGVEYTLKLKEAAKSPDGTYTYAEKGTTYKVTTGEDGIGLSEDLFLGTYEIIETKTPAGYVTDKNIPEVTITNDGTESVKTTVKELQNVKQKTEITIKKKFEKSEYVINKDEKIEVVMGIFTNQDFYNYNQEELVMEKDTLVDVITGVCDIFGNEITLKSEVNLPAGKYYAYELDVSSPYAADGKNYEFEIKHTDTESSKVVINGPTIINTQPRAGGLTLIKFSASSFTEAEDTGIKNSSASTETIEKNLNDFMQELKDKTKEEAKEIIAKQNKISLAGAKYGIFLDEDCLEPLKRVNSQTGELEDAIVVTDTYGMCESLDLPIGKYYLKELVAPEGYELAEKPVEISITLNDMDQFIYRALYDNNADAPSFFVKKDIFTGDTIEDCIFEIRDKDGNVILHSITDKNGEAEVLVDLLKYGETYTYVEISAPGIYNLNTQPHEFVALYEFDEETGKYKWTGEKEVISNLRNTIDEIVIKKVDEQTNEPLSGCRFSIILLDENGEPYINEAGEMVYLAKDEVTGKDGEFVIKNPVYGTYQFIEHEAPEGYENKVNMEGLVFTIDENSPDTVVFEVTNILRVEPPATGDIAVIALVGVAVVSIAGIVFVVLRNRKRNKI